MYSSLEIETDSPKQMFQVLKPSLDADRQVKHEVENSETKFIVETKADSMGQLRGATDGALRLTSLAKKIIEQ